MIQSCSDLQLALDSVIWINKKTCKCALTSIYLSWISPYYGACFHFSYVFMFFSLFIKGPYNYFGSCSVFSLVVSLVVSYKFPSRSVLLRPVFFFIFYLVLVSGSLCFLIYLILLFGHLSEICLFRFWFGIKFWVCLLLLHLCPSSLTLHENIITMQ